MSRRILIAALALLGASTSGVTDAKFEAFGLGDAIAEGRMRTDPALEGQRFTARCGNLACAASAQFVIAKKGGYTRLGYDHEGVYVKLLLGLAFDSDFQCGRLRAVQAFQRYHRDRTGVETPVVFQEPYYLARTGLTDDTALARGWAVDTVSSLIYGTDAQPGSFDDGTPGFAVLRDAPAVREGAERQGIHFETCAVCCLEGHYLCAVQACLRWGFFVDAPGSLRFDAPTLAPSSSDAFRYAVERYEALYTPNPLERMQVF